MTTISIGSGSHHAMFYPVATSLCEVFNKYNQDKNLICKPVISKGAEYNLNAVENGEFTMGISQANLQYDAYTGQKRFTNNPHKKLRTLFTVHNEYLTIIAKKSANIHNFSDLKGKKVNIGNIGSGSRILFEQMIGKLGWNLKDFAKIYGETGSDINKVLCSGDADAAVYIVGHPNKSFGDMLKNCDTKLISLSDKEIKIFVSLAPKDFFTTFIPQNTYQTNPTKIKTFASKTILSTSENISPELINNFVKIIKEHKAELIKKQSALSSLDFLEDSKIDLAPKYREISKQF